MSLEKKFEELEAKITEMEQEDISLEDAFRAYQEGMQLLKQCNEAIDKVEKQVMQLNVEGELVPFEV